MAVRLRGGRVHRRLQRQSEPLPLPRHHHQNPLASHTRGRPQRRTTATTRGEPGALKGARRVRRAGRRNRSGVTRARRCGPTQPRVCVLAEVPPDRRREAKVALGASEGGTRWRSCSTGSPGWMSARRRWRSAYPGPKGRRRAETRTFKTMSGSLRVMRDWLLEAGVSIAAMESTSTYWKPPFYCLEEV